LTIFDVKRLEDIAGFNPGYLYLSRKETALAPPLPLPPLPLDERRQLPFI